MSELHWLTTTPNPYRNAHTPVVDDGQVGWKLHLVRLGERTYKPIGRRDGVTEIDISRALCGLSAKHGWGLDLFINTPCKRCMRKAQALGVPIPKIPE